MVKLTKRTHHNTTATTTTLWSFRRCLRGERATKPPCDTCLERKEKRNESSLLPEGQGASGHRLSPHRSVQLFSRVRSDLGQTSISSNDGLDPGRSYTYLMISHCSSQTHMYIFV